ncbi:MAG: post-segregation antitoxin CcdA [Alphaproteobacteria bacterium]|nr:post-segregation antitoxin CcdA [Alphaproteobacteria bacterium]
MAEFLLGLKGLLGADLEDAPRRPTNVSLNGRLLEEARALDINISRAAERGLALQIAEARAKAWKAENRAAIEASNAYVEKHGLPLARHRRF